MVGSAAAESADALDEAKLKFTSGEAHYRAEKWALAVADFVEAYRLSGAAPLLYNIGQAERHAGNCAAALAYYQQFKATGAALPADLDDKIALMEACTRSPSPQVVPQGNAKVPVEPPPAAPSPTARRDPTRFSIGIGCAAGAVVSATLGTMFAVRAQAADNQVSQVARPGERWGPEYQAYESSGQRSQAAAFGFFLSSGALAGLAGWLLIWDSPASPELPKVAVDAKPGSIALAGSWPF